MKPNKKTDQFFMSEWFWCIPICLFITRYLSPFFAGILFEITFTLTHTTDTWDKVFQSAVLIIAVAGFFFVLILCIHLSRIESSNVPLMVYLVFFLSLKYTTGPRFLFFSENYIEKQNIMIDIIMVITTEIVLIKSQFIWIKDRLDPNRHIKQALKDVEIAEQEMRDFIENETYQNKRKAQWN